MYIKCQGVYIYMLMFIKANTAPWTKSVSCDLPSGLFKSVAFFAKYAGMAYTDISRAIR